MRSCTQHTHCLIHAVHLAFPLAANSSYWIADSTPEHVPISSSTPNLSDWSTPPPTKIPKTFFRAPLVTEENVDALLTGVPFSFSMSNLSACEVPVPPVKKSMSYGDLKFSSPGSLRRPPPPPPSREDKDKSHSDKPKPRPRRKKETVSVLLAEDGHTGEDNDYDSLKLEDKDDYMNVAKFQDSEESEPSQTSALYQKLNVKSRDEPAQYATLKNL